MSGEVYLTQPVEGKSNQYEPYRDVMGRPIPFHEPSLSDTNEWASIEGHYQSYAGTDIVATILLPGDEKPLTLGEIHTLSYSIHRENTPVRYLGHSNVCGFVKGPRTIAGHLVFTQFNQYVWYRLEHFKSRLGRGLYPLADSLPPFDIVMSFQNESGSFSKMKIMGITIVDEGAAMSVDDLMIESDYTFMARAIMPMTAYVPDGFEVVRNWNTGGGHKTQKYGALGVGFK